MSLSLALYLYLSEPLWSPQKKKALHVSCVRLSNIVSIIIYNRFSNCYINSYLLFIFVSFFLSFVLSSVIFFLDLKKLIELFNSFIAAETTRNPEIFLTKWISMSIFSNIHAIHHTNRAASNFDIAIYHLFHSILVYRAQRISLKPGRIDNL